MPDGYRFDSGYLLPSAPADPALLASLGEELALQAEGAAADDEIAVRKLDRPAPDSVLLRYTNGSDELRLIVTKQDPALTKTTVMQNEQDAAEKLTVGGTEAFYIRAGEGERALDAGRNRLGWIDADKNLRFYLFDTNANTLGKADFERLAQDLIARN
ncbi:hypothetical protein B8V81_0127 [Paenibacillus pasadenensis]|uniref:DUF4367 domain-containing protein n=1 Tax=Paenibacillus pasadenensis TaxID=217090 RepID=A0A2N5NCC7_9BACL|nr:hypothetical protein [Paenibacillus pasadenensis]PLT47995.1 hypothetical protein B8V81_0127 [Paenibacillus pasadenensis]